MKKKDKKFKFLLNKINEQNDKINLIEDLVKQTVSKAELKSELSKISVKEEQPKDEFLEYLNKSLSNHEFIFEESKNNYSKTARLEIRKILEKYKDLQR